MRSANKEVWFQSWQEIQQTVRQLIGEPHRFQQQTRNIVVSAFGSECNKGLLVDRIPYYYQKSPLYWAGEIEQIVKLFQKRSDLLSSSMGIIHSADYSVKIDPKILPKSVIVEFPPRGDKSSTIIKSLRRERGEQYFINTWEWFWINIAYALVNLPEIQEKRTYQQDLNQDEMFYILSRNPLLQLIRISLRDYNTAQQRNLWQRMRSILELFVVDQLLFSFKQKQVSSQFKYTLNSHRIAALFLLINSNKSSAGHSLEKYHHYFQIATEHFSKISLAKNNNLRNLIRTWLFLITKDNGIDQKLIQHLDNANPELGWFKLKRCPYQVWIKAIKDIDISHKDIASITATRNHFYRVLKNHNEWLAGFSFLLVLQQFYEFDRAKLTGLIKKPLKKQQDETIQNAFGNNLCHLAEIGVKPASLELIQQKLNNKFKWKQQININFAERSQQATQTLSKTSRENRNSLTYQNPRLRNVWQYPCQQNEYQILLRGTKWIANQIDRIIPGHQKRTHPCINIRIFANYVVFWLLLTTLLLFIRFNYFDKE